ncbi:unnamed protein product [Sphenostylis stenocarpa]|uniref:Uncharacterized protein n=1 Tax=Sphenostylis stenocarpa TaxID=92480 RepID=A0AA86SQ17_9FABA|nr:unnamed protein product [Sphenostylis stenocarpa]
MEPIQVHIEHVLSKEIGHGSDKARFSSTRGTIEGEALFLDATESVVVLFHSKEQFEIEFDPVLRSSSFVMMSKVEECLNGVNLERPILIGIVREEAQVVLPLLFVFVNYGVNVLKVRIGDSPLIHNPGFQNKVFGSSWIWISGLVEQVECDSKKMVLDDLVNHDMTLDHKDIRGGVVT